MMNWYYTPFALPLVIVSTTSCGLTFYAWRHRSTPGATSLGLFMLGVAEWAMGYALELSGADLPTKLFWAKVQYLGTAVAPLALLIFALEYTGRGRWLTRRNLALLCVEPLIVLLLAATNEKHGLLWGYATVETSGPFLAVEYGYGGGFWAHALYSYLLLLVGTVLLASMLFRSSDLYRKQSTAVMGAVLVPWAGNAMYVSGLNPVSPLDLTPFAFALTGMALAWGLFRYRLLDIMPVARDTVFKGMSDGAIVVDAQDRIVDLNPAAQRILRRPSSEAVGRTLAQAIPGRVPLLERRSEAREAYEEVKLSDGAVQRDYRLTLSPLRDRRGRHTGRLIVLRDITELKLKDRLQYMAHHDLLTGLPNRALFLDRLTQVMTQARRSKEPVALLFLDLDRFKPVNDTLGHAAGDLLLQTVAQRLTACVRESDTVARWAGDEFAVLLPGITRAQDAAGVARKILDALSDALVLEGHEVGVTASIGVRLCPPGQDPRTLLRHADIAMYRSKARGGNGYEIYTTGMDSNLLPRLNLETDLRRAVAREEIEVYYQPVVLLETGEIFGVEALARWKHPERGLIPPSEFIPLAEETGLIVPMGQQILCESCRQVRTWQERHVIGSPLKLFVNLSMVQLQQPDFVARALEETRLEPANLVLELTESAMAKDMRAAAGSLQKLKGSCIGLAIDDFGTGYSSLSHLKHLSMDYLKIDASFIRGLGQDPRDAEIVSAIIGLSYALGLTAIAEGVESADQVAQLRRLGCTLAQGYYFTKPLKATSLAKHLKNHVRSPA